MVAVVLVAVTFIAYLAGRMRAAPLPLDILAGAGCGLAAGLHAGSIGAVKRARGIAPHQRLAAAGRRVPSR